MTTTALTLLSEAQTTCRILGDADSYRLVARAARRAGRPLVAEEAYRVAEAMDREAV